MHLEHVGLFKLKDKEQGQWKIISRRSEGFQFDGISGNFHVYGTLSIGLNFDAYDLTKQKNTENFDDYNHFVPSLCGMPFTGEFQLHKAGEVYLILMRINEISDQRNIFICAKRKFSSFHHRFCLIC